MERVIVGESIEESEQGKLPGTFLQGLTRRGDLVDFAVSCLNASVKSHVRLHGTFAQREKVHPCLVSLGHIALLMVVANLAIELTPRIPILEYGLMVELASGH